VPATALAGLYQIKDFVKPDPVSADVAARTMAWTTPDLLIATVVAGAVGYASIHWLLQFLKRYPADIFVIYRILLGIALLILVSIGRIPPR